MVKNPRAKHYRVLGKTLVEWTALKAKVEAYLDANDNLEALDEAQLIALDPALANARLWNELKRELGLTS